LLLEAWYKQTHEMDQFYRKQHNKISLMTKSISGVVVIFGVVAVTG
jgi:hypothetical protein